MNYGPNYNEFVLLSPKDNSTNYVINDIFILIFVLNNQT
jgi:hypothetical protein